MRNDFGEFKRGLLQREMERLSRHDYIAYHRRRYEYVLELCKHEVPDRRASVLDVGPSSLSRALAGYYDDVATLGFQVDWAKDRHAQDRVPSRHIEFDLNDVIRDKSVVSSGQYDLIVFAETIEHLHAAPELVLRMLRDLLRVGGLLVCQTPNASALHKRVRLVLGIQPYERIRIDERNPGHFREYTKSELLQIAETAGLAVVGHEYLDYFGPPEKKDVTGTLGFAVYRVASAFFPSLRRGQTLVARRQ